MLSRFLKSLHFSRRTRRGIQSRHSRCAELLETRQFLSAVTIQLAAANDTTIYQADPDVSNGGGEFILAGGGTRGLVRFDVSAASIPDGATIIDAVLSMNVADSVGESATVSVHRVTTSWGESGSNATGDETTGAPAEIFDATWLYASYDGQLWTAAGGDYAAASAATLVGGIGAYDWFGGGLIDDVQSWIDDAASNFGWLIDLSGSAIKSFVSKDGPDAGLSPTLEITYEEPPAPPAVVEGRLWNDLNADGIQTDALLSNLKLTITNGNTWFNGFGGREHWFLSSVTNRWYFLTEDGTLTRWSGVGRSLTGTVVGTVDPKFYLEPGLVVNSVGSPEPWLDDWTVELLNAEQTVVATTRTAGRDMNLDGVIDPTTEGGWYRFVVDDDAEYTVRQVVPEGWKENVRITYDFSTPNEQGVGALDLRRRNSYFENSGGLGEKWVFSDQTGWYFITPAGALYRWNGVRITAEAPLTGSLIGNPGPEFFENPELLSSYSPGGTDPRRDDARTDFGNLQAQTIRGRVWLDFYANGIRDHDLETREYAAELLTDGSAWFFDADNDDWYIIDTFGQPSYWGPHSAIPWDEFLESGPFLSTEPWLNGRTVELIDDQGNVVDSTVSQSIDLDENGKIDFETERGWYVFEDVPLGQYTIRTVVDENWTQTAPIDSNQMLAAELDSQLGLRTTSNDFRNWGGLNERWIIDAAKNWYYILPDGSLYRWDATSSADNGGLRGTLVARLSPDHYIRLNLLTEPDSSAVMIALDGQSDPAELLFGNHRLLGELL
ncbi:MAG: DNRLRE domain-containing protein [Fuerstiella sp.]